METTLMNATTHAVKRRELASENGVWLEAGIYYVQIAHPAAELPLQIALHGVSTPEQATEAFAILQRGMAGHETQKTPPEADGYPALPLPGSCMRNRIPCELPLSLHRNTSVIPPEPQVEMSLCRTHDGIG